MTATNQLIALASSDVSGSDLVRLFSQKYGADVSFSLANLKAWLAENQSSALVQQYEAPAATGFSVTVAAVNTWLILTPVAGYAAGTIVLPSGVNGAEVLVNCTQSVSTLTITAASGESVIGGPTALTANQAFRLKFDSVLKRWYKVG